MPSCLKRCRSIGTDTYRFICYRRTPVSLFPMCVVCSIGVVNIAERRPPPINAQERCHSAIDKTHARCKITRRACLLTSEHWRARLPCVFGSRVTRLQRTRGVQAGVCARFSHGYPTERVLPPPSHQRARDPSQIPHVAAKPGATLSSQRQWRGTPLARFFPPSIYLLRLS